MAATDRYVLVDFSTWSTRELWRYFHRHQGPAHVGDACRQELGSRTRGGCGFSNRDRAGVYGLAEYYAWSARRMPAPCGNDPRTGRPWPPWNQLGRAIGAAQDVAAARVAYAAARTYPNPFSALAELEAVRRRQNQPVKED